MGLKITLKMGTKITKFLTNDNEHFYEETTESHYKNGEKIGNTLVLEMSKKNVSIIHNDDDDIIIEFKNPESEIYKLISNLEYNQENETKQKYINISLDGLKGQSGATHIAPLYHATITVEILMNKDEAIKYVGKILTIQDLNDLIKLRE